MRVSKDWGAYRLTNTQLMSSGGDDLDRASEEGVGEVLGGVVTMGVAWRGSPEEC